jgi:hypothetical protein
VRGDRPHDGGDDLLSDGGEEAATTRKLAHRGTILVT